MSTSPKAGSAITGCLNRQFDLPISQRRIYLEIAVANSADPLGSSILRVALVSNLTRLVNVQDIGEYGEGLLQRRSVGRDDGAIVEVLQ